MPRRRPTLKSLVQRKNGNNSGHPLLRMTSSVCWKVQFEDGEFHSFQSIFDPWNSPPQNAFEETDEDTLIKDKSFPESECNLKKHRIKPYNGYKISKTKAFQYLKQNYDWRKNIFETL